MAGKKKVASDEAEIELSLWERMELIATALKTPGANSADTLAGIYLRRRLSPSPEEVKEFKLIESGPGAWGWYGNFASAVHQHIKPFGFTEREKKRIKHGFQVRQVQGVAVDDEATSQLLLKFVPIEELEKWAEKEIKEEERARRDNL